MARARRPGRGAGACAVLAGFLLAASGCGDDDGKEGKRPATAKEKTLVAQVSQVPRLGNAPDATKKPDGIDSLKNLPAARPPNPRTPAPRINGVEGVPLSQALDTVANDVALFWQQQFNAEQLVFEPAQQAVIDAGLAYTTCTKDPPLAVTRNASTGPFYCTLDDTVFLPVGSFEKFIAPLGDAATAFVVAHEWGHRVEDNLGLLRDPRYQSGPGLELTADCLAGVWMASVFQRQELDVSDVQEASDILSRIGDNPDAPSANPHGSSEQRVAAFRVGFNDGMAGDCSTILSQA